MSSCALFRFLQYLSQLIFCLNLIFLRIRRAIDNFHFDIFGYLVIERLLFDICMDHFLTLKGGILLLVDCSWLLLSYYY